MKLLIGNFLTLLACISLTSCGSDDKDPNLTINVSGFSSAQGFDYLVAAGSPTLLSMNVYGIYLSPNEDCTSAVKVLDNGDTAEAINFYGTPTLFSGVVADGSYKCFIIEADDILSYNVDDVAVAAHAACVDTATTYSSDLYREGESDDGLWKNTAGEGIDATGSNMTPGADRVFFFASTDLSAATNGTLAIHPNQGIALGAALVVPGATTFYADFNNGIDESGGLCKVEDGAGFGFR